jgi:hypothetical protein
MKKERYFIVFYNFVKQKGIASASGFGSICYCTPGVFPSRKELEDLAKSHHKEDSTEVCIANIIELKKPDFLSWLKE